MTTQATPAAAARRRTRRRRPRGKDPLPELGATLPPELLRDLMTAPLIMTPAQAAPYLALTPARVRLLLRRGELAGVTGARAGAARAVVPRSAVIAYWERRVSA